jgi:hypothetical protein
MKLSFPLVACLAFVVLPDARALPGNSVRQADARVPAQTPAARESNDTVDKPAKPRRSRMAEATPADRPVMRLSAIYRLGDETGKAAPDHCLQSTGSRLKREGSGSASCAGHGQAFVPER